MHMLIPSKGSLKPVSAPKSRLLGKRTGITSLPSGMLLRILPRIPADGTSNRNHFSLDGIKFSGNLFLGGPYGTPIRHYGPHSPLNAFHFVCGRSSSYGAPSEIAKKTPHILDLHSRQLGLIAPVSLIVWPRTLYTCLFSGPSDMNFKQPLNFWYVFNT